MKVVKTLVLEKILFSLVESFLSNGNVLFLFRAFFLKVETINETSWNK